MAKKKDGQPFTKNGQQFADYVQLMAYCCARRNKALALRSTNVDFKREQLTVEADGNTKNLTSRSVDFNPTLKKLLLDMKARRAPDSQWLFPSPQRGAKAIHAMSFRESLELARTHAKLRPVTFNDMRHLFNSFCVVSGLDFMTIANWVGHRDGGILTSKVEGHLADTHTKAAAQRVNFGPVVVEDAASQ
jgi:integrase